jgi:hypothetical protein
MTLILVLGNSDQFIQLSDRRLSAAGKPKTDESDKAIHFTCANARMLVGYSGLAQSGNFNTHRWLMDSLLSCAKPDYDIHFIHKRLQEKANSDFQTFIDIRKLPKRDRRLSVIFSGYLDEIDPPLGVYSIMTNFQDFTTGKDYPEAWDEFQCIYGTEKRPWNGEFSLIQRIGAWPAMTKSDEMLLRSFLEKRKPANAIINKSVKMIRAIADRPKANGVIGKQISSVSLPRDPKTDPSYEYHTNIISYDYYFPSMVRAISDNDVMAVDNALVQTQDKSKATPPIVVPKVGRNDLCPCGSGKRYRKCHGEYKKGNQIIISIHKTEK